MWSNVVRSSSCLNVDVTDLALIPLSVDVECDLRSVRGIYLSFMPSGCNVFAFVFLGYYEGI